MADSVKINFISDQKTENDDSVNFNHNRHLPNPRPAEITPKVLTANPPRPKKRGKIKKIIASLTIILVIVFAVFSSSIIFSNENLIKGFGNLNFLSQIGGLITSGDRTLAGEENDRINFLLTGIGGADHEAGTLTDTMILLSFKPSTKQIAMISIPRDLYVKNGSSWMKINAINAYAEKASGGSGGETTKEFMSGLLNTEIGYYAVIDFDGFEKLIDEFGGIDVYVDNDLIDYQYPIRGKENDWPIASRYETLTIKKGWQHFDGATALKYSRSRHGLGGEGSDFARSKRQQKILVALKNKITQYNFLLNPTKISSLLDAYSNNVSTNLKMWEILKLVKLFKDANVENPINYSLVEGKSPMLYDQMVNGAYVLLPYGGSYDKIAFVWQNIFTVGTSTVKIDYTKWEEFKDQPTSTKATSSDPTAAPAEATEETAIEPAGLEPAPAKETSYQTEGAKLEIQNGTTIEGWASREAGKLKAKGFTVVKTGNAAAKGYVSVKIYDFSGGKYSLTLSELQIIYGVSATPPPAGLKSVGNILIILGQ